MEPRQIDPNMTVDEIMRRWPETVHVVIRHKLHCIGCPFGIFHTVADACAIHEVDERSVAADLVGAMQMGPASAWMGAVGRDENG